MSPDTAKALLDLGTSAMLLAMLYVVYQDGKADRQRLLDKLDAALTAYESIRDRITRIEAHLGMDDPPTKPTRPD